jgi:hypothetical protein
MDISNVKFRGDCTIWGMGVSSVRCTRDNGFKVSTTGSHFRYNTGKLRIYQGLSLTRRLIATIFFDNGTVFTMEESTPDHVLYSSEKVNIGIYGDSTLIISPKEDVHLAIKGNFVPDYEGTYSGELLLIDSLGGISIAPQRYESGYSTDRVLLQRKYWLVEYNLLANNRMMIAAFPGKSFDFDRSFHSESIFVYGARDPQYANPFGEMPPDDIIVQMSNKFNFIISHHLGLYVNSKPAPFNVVNKPEFARFVNTAQSNGIKVAAYSSLFYDYKLNAPTEGHDTSVNMYIQHVQNLVNQFGIQAIYVDGLLPDADGRLYDNKITSWEVIRILREMFGPEGGIIFHGTHRGLPNATMPNVDVYCSVVIYGESVPVYTLNDPYVLYQIRKYGISNAVGYWYCMTTRERKNNLTINQCMDKSLEMNCRGYSFSSMIPNPNTNLIEWGNGFDGVGFYQHYDSQLAIKKEEYLNATVE